MNRSLLLLASSLTISMAISIPVTAETNQQPYLAPLNVESLQTVDSVSGKSNNSYKVDGIEIKLSEKDRHLARNWGLTESEWAKYKYIMEYTPRSLWSPELDPPIALGNMAKTKEERLHYARLLTRLEMARRNREFLMTQAGEQAALEYKHNGLIPPPPKPTGLSAVLTNNRTKLRSIFVDLDQCLEDCKMFLTLAISSSSSKTKIDMHFTGGTESDAIGLLRQIGVSDKKMKSKAISINAKLDNPIVEEFRAGGSVPYYITKTDEKTYRKSMR